MQQKSLQFCFLNTKNKLCADAGGEKKLHAKLFLRDF